jgi:hypothetical protein
MERKLYNKLSGLAKSSGLSAEVDPYSSSASLIRVLSSNGSSEEEVVKGFLSALCDKKKMRQHIVAAVLDSVEGKDVTEEVGTKFYKTIQEKNCTMEVSIAFIHGSCC